ncbi:hypothetical protein CPB85DRAFT_1436976 [Mucidula mucida]|nr:hypothetical protein CPB85DRAFT_1436976 [Mucidula mucida]
MSNPEERFHHMHAMLDLLAPVGSRTHQAPSLVSPAAPDGHVVLVTGTTGFLGTGILARSAKDGTALEDRQRAAFEERGYDATLIDLPKLLLIETSISGHGLGVDSRLEEDMRNNITHIIHNAWRVHFNLPLSTFKPILQGMRVLIDFAMGAPNMKRFIFISSAAIFNNVGDPNILVPELSLHDGSVVVRNGYVESKWIAEQMLYRTAKDFTAFRPLVVRVGVVTGSPNSAWSPTDFVPAIVKSSLHSEMRCLPAYPGHCSWVPLDVAARTIIDYLNANENVDTVHLVHPIIQPSVNIMYWIKTITNLPIVPFSEWIGKLKLLASTSGIDYSLHIPAIKLIPFFEDEARSNGFPSLILRNDVALRLSGSLRRAEAVSMVDVASWMSYWAKIGFLPPSVAERARVFLGQGNHPSRM